MDLMSTESVSEESRQIDAQCYDHGKAVGIVRAPQSICWEHNRCDIGSLTKFRARNCNKKRTLRRVSSSARLKRLFHRVITFTQPKSSLSLSRKTVLKQFSNKFETKATKGIHHTFKFSLRFQAENFKQKWWEPLFYETHPFYNLELHGDAARFKQFR